MVNLFAIFQKDTQLKTSKKKAAWEKKRSGGDGGVERVSSVDTWQKLPGELFDSGQDGSVDQESS